MISVRINDTEAAEIKKETRREKKSCIIFMEAFSFFFYRDWIQHEGLEIKIERSSAQQKNILTHRIMRFQ